VNFEIRRADPDDAAEIAEAHRDSIRVIGSRYYDRPIVDAWVGGVQPENYVRAMSRGEKFFVALGSIGGERKVLGFSTHRVDGERHRTAVYVRGDAARQGIGTALFRTAEADVVASGAAGIQIDASLGAVPFYTANGFEETGRGELRLRSGDAMACVFMTKTLDKSVATPTAGPPAR
jgi:putative acetyltransferase